MTQNPLPRLLGFVVALAFASACASTPDAAPTPAPKPGPSAPSQPAAPKSAQFTPDATLQTCPITISNAPRLAADGRTIADYKPFAVAAPNVLLAISPVNGACLTSGFGPRGNGQHKGVDLQSKPANMVHAAAKGRIVEAGVRPDYGNYVVIDHGQNVFTRYAHLKALEAGVTAGAEIPFGQPLGVMGATSAFSIPVHLHYEVLRGDYNTPKQSFGLAPVDIFSLPRAN